MTPVELERLERAIADRDTVAVMDAAPGLLAEVRRLRLGVMRAIPLADEAADELAVAKHRYEDAESRLERARKRWHQQVSGTDLGTVADRLDGDNWATDAATVRVAALRLNEAEELCLELFDEAVSGGVDVSVELREKLAAMRERRK